MGAPQSLRIDDASATAISKDRMDGALLTTTVILSTIGVLFVTVGLVLFIVDLSVTNHGLPTAGGILALLGGGLALLWAGVPYSGALVAALGVVALLMGGTLLGVLGSSRALRGSPAITGREGMIGEVGTVRSPVGVESEGWVFVHGELWRAVLAFAPEESNAPGEEPVIEAGRKVAVVGFADGVVVEVVPVGGGASRSIPSSPGP